MVTTPLSDDALQDVIEQQEAWLARRIGPLTGPRTVTIPRPTRHAPIVLARPASAVTVTDVGTEVDVVLVGQHVYRDGVHPLPWIGPVTITYTPDDEAEVRRVVIELIRDGVSQTAFDSETIGDYSYSRGGTSGRGGVNRAGLVRSLLPATGAPTSVRLQTGWAR